MPDKSFAAWVLAGRQFRGWSQMELAEKSGVSQSAISALENGTLSNPRLKTIRALEDVLEASFFSWSYQDNSKNEAFSVSSSEVSA